MTLNGWIIYNGHLPGTSFLDYAERIQLAAQKKGINLHIIKNNQLLSFLSSKSTFIIETRSMVKPNFVIFADKDIHLARQLEYLGIPVFNSAEAIEICDNKITTYQHLANHQLPIPRSIIGPKIFPGVTQLDLDSFLVIEDYFDYPVVLKEAYGSFGQQVYLINSKQELMHKLHELKDTPYLIQEFIDTSFGKDLRLNVVGDQVVASMLRYSDNDFRSNLPTSNMKAYQPSEQEKQLAIAATKVIGADFAGIDLLFGKDGPIICEVNSNAHIKKTYQSTGINVADYIIELVIERLTERNAYD